MSNDEIYILDQRQRLYQVYVAFNSLRENTLRLQRGSEKIHEISMNAAIAASQSGDRIRVFSEIARQIAMTSEKMSHEIQSIYKELSLTINRALQAVVIVSRYEKLSQATPNLSGKENRYLLRCVLEQSRKRIDEIRSELTNDLLPLGRRQNTVKQLHHRLFSILNVLEIEVSSTGPTGISTSNVLIDSLSDSLSCLEEEADRFNEKFRECSGLLDKSAENYGRVHAQGSFV